MKKLIFIVLDVIVYALMSLWINNVGGSSGSAMHVALQVAKTMKKGQTLVVILPDGIRNYMSKFVQDEWMQERGHNIA